MIHTKSWLKSSTMDGIESLRCQNDCIDLGDKKETFMIDITLPLVVKNGNNTDFY